MSATAPTAPAIDARPRRGALPLALAMAALDWAALADDASGSIGRSLAMGHGLARAVFVYARYFTILSNLFLAVAMSVTAAALLRRRPLPPAGLYRALLAYMIVTGITYELLLRGTWSPHGLQFATDLVFHDVEPVLTVVFWAAFAPKKALRWRTLPALLAFPAAYLALTLAAGLLGAGYPYDFLDPRVLGAPGLAGVAAVFLCLFLGLGALATLVGSASPRAA